MAFIYKITNSINGKSYIGKTCFSIEKRFKEHQKDAFRDRNEKRPLYSAMRKYGIENFTVEQIEECSDMLSSEREKYWIEYYNTYINGYNATKGGDGKIYIDYNLVIEKYKELHTCSKVAEELQICDETVSRILQSSGIKPKTAAEISKEKNSKKVAMLDMEGNIEQIFSSVNEAANFLINSKIANAKLNSVNGNISRVANGERKSAYKKSWKYV